jgi:RNA polymerase sigma-70 factor (ECF subfamily)
MSFDTSRIVSSDEELIQNLQENNLLKRKAEDALFNRYTYFIKEGIKKYALQEDESFDAYSDTILHAIDNIRKGHFENRSALKTYLYRIFINKCVDLLRKKTTNKNSVHHTSSIPDMLMLIADPAKTAVQQLIERMDMDALKNRLQELGESCRKLLMLFADGYSDKEISVLMEYRSADVVKTSRLRCIDKLRLLYNVKRNSDG